MRLYLVNPDNPIVSLNKVRSNRLNRYRVWKPLGLLVVAGLTPSEWAVTLLDENHRMAGILDALDQGVGRAGTEQDESIERQIEELGKVE